MKNISTMFILVLSVFSSARLLHGEPRTPVMNAALESAPPVTTEAQEALSSSASPTIEATDVFPFCPNFSPSPDREATAKPDTKTMPYTPEVSPFASQRRPTPGTAHDVDLGMFEVTPGSQLSAFPRT